MGNIVFDKSDLEYIYKTLDYRDFCIEKLKRKDSSFVKRNTMVERLIENESHDYSENHEKEYHTYFNGRRIGMGKDSLSYKVGCITLFNTVVYVKKRLYKIDKDYFVEDISDMFPFLEDIHHKLEENKRLDEEKMAKHFTNNEFYLKNDEAIDDCIKINNSVDVSQYRLFGKFEKMPDGICIDFDKTHCSVEYDRLKKVLEN